MAPPQDTTPFALRQLPLPARVTLAVFLVAIGFGYLAGLVQLHFAHAKSGGLLPSAGDIQEVFHGSTGQPISKIERLLEAPESAPFNGSGSMRAAFTSKSSGWKEELKKRPEAELRAERETERLILLNWIRAGAPKKDFEEDCCAIPDSLKARPLPESYLTEDKKGLRLRCIWEDRCMNCHQAGGADSKAARFPLSSYETILPYATPKRDEGMSLEKRAMFTHAHFLSFALVFGITGVLFTLTSFPIWLRLLLGPLPLLAQLAEMACWWLAIIDPVYASVIQTTGAVVAVGLVLQILATLFHLFGRTGRAVLLLLILIAGVAGWQVKTMCIDPYLAAKRQPQAK